MSTLTVDQVVGQGNPYGPNKDVIPYSVIFREHPGKEVTWGRKTAPTVGQQVVGKIDWENQYGAKFKQDRPPGDPGKAKSPEEIAQIQRQHSQEMALRLLAMTDTFKGFDLASASVTPQVRVAMTDLIARLADWFDRDIAQGAQRAINAANYGKEEKRKDIERTGQTDLPVEAPKHREPVEDTDDIPF